METSHQRGVLAEVFRQIHPGHMIIRGHQRTDRADGIIGRAIVDQNDLILIPLQLSHRCFDFVHHTADRFR